MVNNIVGDFGVGSVIEEVAGIPLEEYGDTMRVEAVIVGDGHKRRALFLPGEFGEDATGVVSFVVPTYEMSTAETLAWLKQSDDPVEPIYHANTKVVKAVVRKAKRQIDQNVAWKVYERAEYKCEYCNATGVPLTYDHWLAQAYGGETTLENGVSSCRPCNKAKGHLTVDEWVTFMQERGYPNADHWADKAKSR